MKKLSSWLVTATMIVTLSFGFHTDAATSKTLEVVSSFSKTTLAAGESLIQTISFLHLNNVNTGVRAFKLVCSYDSTKFNPPSITYIGVTFGECTVSSTGGTVVFLYADTDNGLTPATEGNILSLTYTAKSDVTDGPSSFTLSAGISSYIDSSYRLSQDTNDVKQRYISPVFSDATKIVTIFNGPLLSSLVYTVANTTVSGLGKKTVPSTFISGIVTNPRSASIKILDKNMLDMNAAGYSGSYTYVGTGNLVEIYNGTSKLGSYTILLTGDTTGDGQISALDLITVKNHLISKTQLKGVYASAAELDGVNGISILDLLFLKTAVLC